MKNAEGVSIYLPQIESDTELYYKRLNFARDTRWPDFLSEWANR